MKGFKEAHKSIFHYTTMNTDYMKIHFIRAYVLSKKSWKKTSLFMNLWIQN